MTDEDRKEVERIIRWAPTPWATRFFVIILAAILSYQIGTHHARITALETQVKELNEHKP